MTARRRPTAARADPGRHPQRRRRGDLAARASACCSPATRWRTPSPMSPSPRASTRHLADLDRLARPRPRPHPAQPRRPRHHRRRRLPQGPDRRHPGLHPRAAALPRRAGAARRRRCASSSPTAVDAGWITYFAPYEAVHRENVAAVTASAAVTRGTPGAYCSFSPPCGRVAPMVCQRSSRASKWPCPSAPPTTSGPSSRSSRGSWRASRRSASSTTRDLHWVTKVGGARAGVGRRRSPSSAPTSASRGRRRRRRATPAWSPSTALDDTHHGHAPARLRARGRRREGRRRARRASSAASRATSSASRSSSRRAAPRPAAGAARWTRAPRAERATLPGCATFPSAVRASASARR